MYADPPRSSEEIAISPYIIPLPDKDEEPALPSPSTSPSDTSSKLQPRDLYPLTLFSQTQLVIPQKPLYGIFAYAAQRLARDYPRNTVRELLQCVRASSNALVYMRSSPESQHKRQDLDSLTRIMMIQNPEHARALNIRKMLVRFQILQSVCDDDIESRADNVVRAELEWTSLILGIASHAKVGLLWHHRRWLLTLLASGTTSTSPYCSISRVRLQVDSLKAELEVVDKCAQKYPRNYMAWSHRNWLLHSIVGGGADMVQGQLEKMSAHMYTNTKDHTAAQHIIQFLLLLQRQSGSKTLYEGCLVSMQETACDLVARYPDRETVWLFLRQMVQVSGLKTEFAKRGALLAERLADGGMENRAKSELGYHWTSEEAHKARRCAIRTSFFLAALSGASSCQHEGGGLASLEARRVLRECREESE